MILCYTYRVKPRIIIIREVSLRNWWKQIQKPMAKHGKSYGNPAEEIKESRRQRVQHTTKKWPTGSNNHGSYGLQEIQPTIRELEWVWSRSSEYVLCCTAWCSCGLPNSGSKGYLCLFCLLLGPLSSYWGGPPTAIIWWDVLTFTVTWNDIFGWYLWEACPFLKGKEEEWILEKRILRGGGMRWLQYIREE